MPTHPPQRPNHKERTQKAMLEGGDVVQLAECLPSTQEALGSTPSFKGADTVFQAWNLGSRDRRIRPSSSVSSEGSLGYRRLSQSKRYVWECHGKHGGSKGN